MPVESMNVRPDRSITIEPASVASMRSSSAWTGPGRGQVELADQADRVRHPHAHAAGATTALQSQPVDDLGHERQAEPEPGAVAA